MGKEHTEKTEPVFDEQSAAAFRQWVASPPGVYAWPRFDILCGDCGRMMEVLIPPFYSPVKAPGNFIPPEFGCFNDHCPRFGKVYELSTASAVILHEVAAAKPAVQHGVDCPKIGHIDEVQTRFDYFHAENSDGPFVSKRDGKTYCGRCHVAL